LRFNVISDMKVITMTHTGSVFTAIGVTGLTNAATAEHDIVPGESQAILHQIEAWRPETSAIATARNTPQEPSRPTIYVHLKGKKFNAFILGSCFRHRAIGHPRSQRQLGSSVWSGVPCMAQSCDISNR